jgi:hypothetical protein
MHGKGETAMSDFVKPEYFILVIFAIQGAIGGWLAYNRGRTVAGWCVLCALFPIFLLVIYFHKPLKEVPGKFKRCHSCREFIKWRDAVCKYCQAEQPTGKQENG